MRPLRLFQSCWLLFAYALPAFRAEEIAAVNPRSRAWPYMAFVYYTDDTIKDANGARFIRGAVILTPEHLLVSSIDRINATEGFPEKTLVARAGAITTDDVFTLNEDENEQDREVIKVYRPSKETDKWWSADMQLIRVVKAFNITSAVNISSSLPPLHSIAKDLVQCSLLFYNKRYKNESDDRILTEANMTMLAMSQCSNFENDNLTICLGPTKSTSDQENYCIGNTGGPVMCDERVTAMHSLYTEGCGTPHVYKTLDTWASFINCAIEDTCNSSECSEVCIVEPKDTVEPPTLRSGNKTAEESDVANISQANSTYSTNSTFKQSSTDKQIRIKLVGNDTGVLQNVSTTVANSSFDSKVRMSSKKSVHLRAGNAGCSLRAPSGIVYFIVSRLAFGLYSNEFVNA